MIPYKGVRCVIKNYLRFLQIRIGASVATLKRICVMLGISADQILFGNALTDHAAVLAEKCRPLSDVQYNLLLQIVERYVAAVQSKRGHTQESFLSDN